MRIRAAIGKGDHALQLIEGRPLDALLGSIPKALEDKGLRCTRIHVHGIQLVDQRKQVCLRGDEPAFENLAALNAAGYWRDDQRVIEIKLGLDDIGICPL